MVESTNEVRARVHEREEDMEKPFKKDKEGERGRQREDRE